MSFVESVAANAGPDLMYGTPLTADETAELDRRVGVQSSLDPLSIALSADPDFGGLYIDKLTGDIVITARGDGAKELALADLFDDGLDEQCTWVPAMHLGDLQPMQLMRFLALSLLVAACSVSASPSPSPRDSVTIPTATAEAQGVTCGGGAVVGPMTLRGDARTSPGAWVEWSGKKIPITFPLGFYATFEPSLVVRDGAGAAIAREGDDINVNPQQWKGLYICAAIDVVRVYLQSDVMPASS